MSNEVWSFITPARIWAISGNKSVRLVTERDIPIITAILCVTEVPSDEAVWNKQENSVWALVIYGAMANELLVFGPGEPEVSFEKRVP